jgi:hypothetical protein
MCGCGGGDRARFAQHTRVLLRDGGRRGQALERDAALEARIMPEEDLAHPPAPIFSRIW